MRAKRLEGREEKGGRKFTKHAIKRVSLLMTARVYRKTEIDAGREKNR